MLEYGSRVPKAREIVFDKDTLTPSPDEEEVDKSSSNGCDGELKIPATPQLY